MKLNIQFKDGRVIYLNKEQEITHQEIPKLVAKNYQKNNIQSIIWIVFSAIVVWRSQDLILETLEWWHSVIAIGILYVIYLILKSKRQTKFIFNNNEDETIFNNLSDKGLLIQNAPWKIGEKETYISYGLDKKFKVSSNILYSKLELDKKEYHTFFMPGFLWIKGPNGDKVLDYSCLKITYTETFGVNYPVLKKVNEDDVVLSTWRYVNQDGSKNKVRKNNWQKQIHKAGRISIYVNKNDKEYSSHITFTGRELAQEIVQLIHDAYKGATVEYIKKEDRTDPELLAYLFVMVAGGTDMNVDFDETKKIKEFVQKITKKSDQEAFDLTMKQWKLYMQLMVCAKGLGATKLWAQEYVILLEAIKNTYDMKLCQEIYDSAKEIAFADGHIDEGEKMTLKTMKDILKTSDSKKKSRVASVDDLNIDGHIDDSDKKSTF